ncbi:MAG: hypothetical protein RLZZ628_2785 [Bacteroidota bacterium]|jgi:hypothetical protein
MITRPYLLFFFCLFTQPLFAQLTGNVTGVDGAPLAFASIYVENTAMGTTANALGDFQLELPNGTYKIVFQYVGYSKHFETILVKDKKIHLKVRLEAATIEMATFTIRANQEDPAYAIMRQAIAARPHFRNQVPQSVCDVYMKGVQKVLEKPQKIMGQKVELDSGIVYLSETLSKLYCKAPDAKKEILTASKVSGNDNGFGFNSATNFEFNFYDNTMTLLREVLSPIAEHAIANYRFKLIGTIQENQRALKKIEVIPIRAEDPTWAGYIYIVENQWNLHSLDLYLTGKTVQNSILDTFRVRQVFVNLQNDVWRLLSQEMQFKINILKIKIAGYFTGVFTNYDLKPNLPNDFFNKEVFRAEKGKKDHLLAHWDTLRPIPLTSEEHLDYVKKDSIQIVHKSKPYLDSVDKKQNRFKISNLLTGYNYYQSLERQSFSWKSPLTMVQFHPVTGTTVGLNAVYHKDYDDLKTKYFNFNPAITYSWTEKAFRPQLTAIYHANELDFSEISFSAGRKLSQYNAENPIPTLVSEFYNLFLKQNLMKLYDKNYVKMGYGREIANGVQMNLQAEWARRAELQVNSSFSYFKKNEPYAPNLPENILSLPDDNSKYLAIEGNFRFRFGQTYARYPTQKVYGAYPYPELTMAYQKAFNAGAEYVYFNKIKFRLQQTPIKMNLYGYSEYAIDFGTFLGKQNLSFADYFHFNGNETPIGSPNQYMTAYHQLPYYQYSTAGTNLQLHYQHHFQGFILDKIPYIRKLGLNEVIRVAYLKTPELKNYTEFSLGIDRIGWGIFRILRVDLGTSFTNGQVGKPSLLFGIKL